MRRRIESFLLMFWSCGTMVLVLVLYDILLDQ